MRARGLVVAVVLLAVMIRACSGLAAAQDGGALGPGVNQVLNELDTEEFEGFLESLNSEASRYLPEFDIAKIASDPASLFDPVELLHNAGAYVAGEVLGNLSILGALVMLAVLAAALQVLAAGMNERGPVFTAQVVCRMVLVIMGVSAFERSANIGLRTVENMMNLIYAMMPALVSAMAASGGIATAAVASPVLAAAAAAMGTIVRSTVVPLLMLATVLSLVGDIGGRKQVTRIASIMRQWAFAILGLGSTLFVATAGIRSGITKVSDAAAGKAAKFLAGSMVPVVGKVFADALDVIVASSALVRGALGAFGLVALALVCLFPLLKMASIMLAFRIAGALCQPLADDGISDCLWELADALQALCLAVGTVGLMFYLCLAAFAGFGGVLPR